MVDARRIQSTALTAIRTQKVWAAIVVVAAVAAGMPPLQDAAVSPDSAGYLEFTGGRMPVYSALASALGGGYALIVVQFLMSLAAWCWLGWVAARAVGVLVGALIAGSGPVVMWDVMALSESTTLTLLVASIAATIVLYKRWTRTRFVLWCVVVALFALTRTTNMFLLPFLVVPFLAKKKRQLLYTAAAALVVMVVSDVYSRTAGATLRKVSLVNVYTGRLLIEPRWQKYFLDRGMPIKREMEPYVGVGKTGRDNMRSLFRACPEFREWFDENGTTEFYRWLIVHPRNFKLPWIALVRNLNFMNLQYAGDTRVRMTNAYLIWFYAAVHVPWWLWLAGLMLPLVAWRLLGRVTPDSLFIVALMIGLYVQAYVGYHGDRAEVSRHVILALVLYKITILLMLSVVAGTIVEWRRSGKPRSQ
jgi:hypothetical protein